jgi:ribosome-interacting GTPase 1
VGLVHVVESSRTRFSAYNSNPVSALMMNAEPVCLQKKKSTVADFCAHIHKDLLKSFSHALVWGLSTKHSPQRVGRDHQLEDEDVLQIVKKG